MKVIGRETDEEEEVEEEEEERDIKKTRNMGDSDSGNNEEKLNSMADLHICIIWFTCIMKK